MILLYGTMGNVGPAAFEALSAAGVEAVLVDFPQNLFRDEPGYRRELLKAVERFKPEAVMPVGHPLALSRMRDELSRLGVAALVERESLIRTLDSKVAFSRLAADLGLPQPRFYDTPDDIPPGMRIIFKRDVSFGGHGVHRPCSIDALRNLIAHQSPGEPFLIEDYIDGEDWSVDAVRGDDKTFFYSSYRTTEASGNGPSQSREVVDEPVLGEIARTILTNLDYKGVCGFDFRKDSSDGRFYLLEANPRFTAGLASQADAGFNIPYMLYSIFTNLAEYGKTHHSLEAQG